MEAAQNLHHSSSSPQSAVPRTKTRELLFVVCGMLYAAESSAIDSRDDTNWHDYVSRCGDTGVRS